MPDAPVISGGSPVGYLCLYLLDWFSYCSFLYPRLGGQEVVEDGPASSGGGGTVGDLCLYVSGSGPDLWLANVACIAEFPMLT